MDDANLFKKLCLLLLSSECYEEFFVKFNILHAPCLKATFSLCLGYAIIAGSLLVKVPQLIKLYQAKSAEGISLISVLLDLSAMTANVAYNFVLQYPFSSWGDGLFVMIQTAMIGAMVLYYDGSAGGMYAFLSVYVGLLGVLLGGFTPLSVLTFLQTMVLPVVILGKGAQILANYRNGSTGQLSAVTVMLLFAGSLARIFTTLQETGDTLLLFMFIATSTLNGLVAAQVVFYWNATPKGQTNADKRKAKKNK